jgi:hypothetical protein
MAGELSEKKRETSERITPASAVSPHADPVEYLLSKGWKCLGNPQWESSQWLDPEQPLAPSYTEQPCMVDAVVRENYVDPNTSERRTRYKVEQRQILCQTGDGGALQGGVRQVFHPAVTPVAQSDALLRQIQRDAAEQTRKLAEEEKKRK